jgi:nitroimidazol reductase NimA-like FMN-containing flavoprotein (pyridoxamine 5'-phosphate oxidase superfamily)
MDDDEIAAFLDQNLKVQVATTGRDGVPHLTTLFYVLDEGRIAFWTYGSSQKIRNCE